MGWPTSKGRCSKPASEVGHGIFLCLDCQETTASDLRVQKRKRNDADKELKRFAQREAGLAPVHDPIFWGRGEISGGRMEENRRKH